MRKVFVNAGGQQDNIGDSLLRRAYVDALRPIGELHVYTGDDAGYTSGLGLRPEDKVYSSRGRWLRSTVLSSVKSPIVFAINTGEVVGASRERLKGAWQPLVSAMTRLRGGRCVVAGVSVRPGTEAGRTWLPSLARSAAYASSRDQWSRDAVGVGDVLPDWAFLLGRPSAEIAGAPRRPYATISMRGDRPAPDEAWYDAVRAFAAELDCTPLVVVQVRRDAERAREIAGRLGAEVVEWPTGSPHSAHEELMRATYRDSAVVLSDRIHSLIVGFTEGAVPVGVTTASPTKIERTLSVVTDVPVWPASSRPEPERWREVVRAREKLFSDLDSARDRLGRAAEELRTKAS